MVEKVEAYKCLRTGRLFSNEDDAVECEFKSMMKEVGGKLPAMGSVSPTAIMEWLANGLMDGVYPTAFDELYRALQFWRENGDAIETITEEELLRGLEVGGLVPPASSSVTSNNSGGAE